LPTYEYACESCGARYEKREGFSAKARQKCQQCGKNTAQRMLFAPPIVFKGSGFYKTDSRGSDGDSGSSEATPTAPDLGAAVHGHSHGPGGHTHGPGGQSHDTPAATESKSDKKPKKDTATESAAAS
jgi:putative FmdB family regulatory protein